MGFQLRCVIARANDLLDAEALAASLRDAIPFTLARVFERPFLGVIVGAHPDDLVAAFDDDPAAFASLRPDEGGDDERRAALEWAIAEHLPAASQRFPGRAFAYVEVECFGGTCYFSGKIIQNGETLWQLESMAHDGHLQLLARLGLTDLDWHFEPFTRDFLHGREEPRDQRRAIVGAVDGSLSGLPLERITVMLLVALQPEWAVRPLGGRTSLLRAGDDDVLLSLNAKDDGTLELGGHSHTDHERAAALLELLAEGLGDFGVRGELSLRAFTSGELVRRWAPG